MIYLIKSASTRYLIKPQNMIIRIQLDKFDHSEKSDQTSASLERFWSCSLLEFMGKES